MGIVKGLYTTEYQECYFCLHCVYLSFYEWENKTQPRVIRIKVEHSRENVLFIGMHGCIFSFQTNPVFLIKSAIELRNVDTELYSDHQYHHHHHIIFLHQAETNNGY